MAKIKLSLKNLKLSRWTWIALIVVGVVLCLWLVLTFAGFFDPPKSIGKKQVDPNRCPHCNMPLSKFAKEKGECLFCHGELGVGEKAAKNQVAGKVIAIVLGSVFGVLLLVNIVFFVRAQIRKRKGEDLYHLHHCHKCSRKIRFRASQANQFARCPKCRQIVRFPPLPPPPRPWWQLWKKKPKQAV